MKPALRNLALIGASLVLALALAEAGLRLAGVSYPEFHRLDPALGWSPRPGVEGWWTREGRAYVRINRAGFRDRDHALEKPDGTYRIAVLGDSFTEAREVPLAKTFWALIERDLATCPALGGRPVEVLDFGVAGYGSAQELLVLRQKALAYAPDLVLLAFYIGNDVLNNSKPLDGHPDRPYLVRRGDGWALDMSFRDQARFKTKLAWQDIKHGIVNASALVQLAKEAYYRVKFRLTGKFARQAEALDRVGPETEVLEPPPNGAWRAAWSITETLIGMIADEARAGGARLRLAILGAPIQIDPDGERRRRLAARLGVADLDYPQRRLAAFAAAKGIAVSDLVAPMRALAEGEGVYLHGFPNTAPGTGHWNARGHAVAGARLAADICATLSRVTPP